LFCRNIKDSANHAAKFKSDGRFVVEDAH